MRPYATFILVWFITGVGTFAGSVAGAAVGQRGLFVGAVIGGILGAMAAVTVAVRLRWLGTDERRLATIGAVSGFLIAVPVAVSNLGTPITPVLICGLSGAGALFGAGLARRR